MKELKNMNDIKIKKNFFYSTFFQILIIAIPFITTPYVSRILGVEGIGIQSYTTAIQTYFSLFAALGTSSYGAKVISQNRNDKRVYSILFWEIELVTIITTFICILVWFGFILFTNSYKIYYAILSLNIFAVLFDISWFFSGLEEYKIIVVWNTIVKLLGMLSIYVFVTKATHIGRYIFILAITTLISNVFLWFSLPKFLVKISYKEIRLKKHFKETFIYFVPTIATSVYTVLDKTLIGVITGSEEQNGIYEQAQKIINAAKTIVFNAINSVVGVRISFLYAEEKYAEIKGKIENSINYILCIGVACVFGLLGVAPNFVPVFLGDGYEGVIMMLYLFSPIIVIIGISNCLGSQYYIPSGKRAKSALYLIIGAGVNLALNLILIPILESYGAAIASVLAELLITTLYVKNCDGYINFKYICTSGVKKIISGIIMFFGIKVVGWFLMEHMIISLVVQVVTGVGVYLTMLLILRDKWTINILKESIDFVRKKEK